MRSPKPFFRKFNQTWYVQFGKQQIALAKGKENEHQAYQRFYELMAKGGPNVPVVLPKPSELTVAQLCDHFLDWCQKHNAPTTYQLHLHFLQDFCNTHGRTSALEIKPFHVTKWLDQHPEWKAARRHAIQSLKRTYNWGNDEGIIESNPLKKLKKPRSNVRTRLLTPEERQAILDSYPAQDPFRQFLIAMQETGARPGEIASVTSAHVDLKNGIWILHQHKTAKVTEKPKPRIIILTPTMIELTTELMEQFPEGPLFRNGSGKSWNRNSIRCRFRRVREKLGLGEDVVAYLYRHSFATEALANGAGLVEVCELLGHTSTDMVMRHYQHLGERREHLRKAAMKATQSPSITTEYA